ncbi:hypothetical protein JXL83_04045 [candidate division WOR-3 bacterium]|nr:hypothetical protein [candidate division WOR-3 bacterium]
MSFVERIRQKAPSWFRADYRKVVFSTRVRLARNFDVKKKDAQEIAGIVEKAVSGRDFIRINLWEASESHCRILAERHLLNSSPSFGLCLFVSPDEKTSILVNDEDDVRIQIISVPGKGQSCLSEALSLSGEIESAFPFARTAEGDFETACPTNRGTGMRYSNLFHAPCVFLSGNEKKIVRAAKACGLALRGIFGEGTKTAGSFCQISNQKTSEKESKAMDEVDYFSDCFAENELFAREYFVMYNKKAVENYLKSGFEIFGEKKVSSLKFSEYANAASVLRLGFDLGLEERYSEETVSDLFFILRRGHRDAIIEQTEGGEDLSLAMFVEMTARKA